MPRFQEASRVLKEFINTKKGGGGGLLGCPVKQGKEIRGYTGRTWMSLNVRNDRKVTQKQVGRLTVVNQYNSLSRSTLRTGNPAQEWWFDRALIGQVIAGWETGIPCYWDQHSPQRTCATHTHWGRRNKKGKPQTTKPNRKKEQNYDTIWKSKVLNAFK